jgi:methylmalonyl-CoA mutase
VGVNTFLNPDPPELGVGELIRSSEAERDQQLDDLAAFQERNAERTPAALARLKDAARRGANVFAELMDAARVCSLGQISRAFYEVGGQYRRSM